MPNKKAPAHKCISPTWQSDCRPSGQVHGIAFLRLPTDATPAQVLLCSVSGDIFPKADEEQAWAQLGPQQPQQQGAEVRQAYLGVLLGIVLPWVAPADHAMHAAAANSEAELLDACRSACLPACLLSQQYIHASAFDRFSGQAIPMTVISLVHASGVAQLPGAGALATLFGP